MKRKFKKTAAGNIQNPPIEISEQDLNLIRARETSRPRRKNIEWFSL